MARDQFEFVGGGQLRDKYGRPVIVAVAEHTDPAMTDIRTGLGVQDADGREQVVLIGAGTTSTSVALVVERTAASSSTTAAVVVPDPATAGVTIFPYTLAVATTTLTFPTAAVGKSLTLALTQDATGSRLVTWPGTVKWGAAGPPTLSTAAGKLDLFTFLCVDGTNWLGSYSLGY